MKKVKFFCLSCFLMLVFSEISFASGPDSNTVKQVQAYLSERGYDCGQADGVMGKKTRKAIKAFKKEQGLTADGEITEELLQLIGVPESVPGDDVLLSVLRRDAGCTDESVHGFICEDFDGDHEYEAFAMVGEYIEEEYMPPYISGQVWYINPRNAYPISDPLGYVQIDGSWIEVLTLKEHKVIHFKEDWGNGQASFFWQVKGGQPYESRISGSGYLSAWNEDGDIQLTVGRYDAAYDHTIDGWMGHTWKPYYFYYDEGAEDFTEYGGTGIGDKELVLRLCGVDIYKEISATGFPYAETIYRANGILTINFNDGSNYENASYDLVAGKWLDPWNHGTQGWEDSTFQGKYEDALFWDYATFGRTLPQGVKIDPPDSLEEKLHIMEPLIEAYAYRYYDGESVIYADLSSKNSADFWNIVRGPFLFGFSSGLEDSDARSPEWISNLCYALFNDFEGDLPPLGENMGISQGEDGKYEFMLAQPEEREFILESAAENEDGSVDAVYVLRFLGNDDHFKDYSRHYVHLVPNEHVDEESLYPLYFTLDLFRTEYLMPDDAGSAEQGTVEGTPSSDASGIQHDAMEVFSRLPSEFVFSSGAGAWGTELNVYDDGSFTGKYYDSNLGESGADYPKGTTYYCDFKGKFSSPVKESEYVYSVGLESLVLGAYPGTIYFENGVRYISSEPRGMMNPDQFYIYLPGAVLTELPDYFLGWAHLNKSLRDTIPSGIYGIYNPAEEAGFRGEAENNLWDKNFVYYYQGRKSTLCPSYSSSSLLMFYSDTGEAVIWLSFDWTYDDQTEFYAYDSNGSGNYVINLDISDDLSSVIVNVRSEDGEDLSDWGGTSDGYIYTEYIGE